MKFGSFLGLLLTSGTGWHVEAAGCTSGYSACCNGKCIRTSYIQDGGTYGCLQNVDPLNLFFFFFKKKSLSSISP